MAHRGASATSPENTLEAFDAAIAVGAPVVEFDVRLTSDGAPVVIHDPEVSRVANGEGFVHELSLAELQGMSLADGGRIPTLREVLDLVSGRVGINVEIKNIPGEPAFDSPAEAVLEACLRELHASAFSGPVLLSSFNWLTIERCLELEPSIATGFLTFGAIDARAALVYAREAGHRWVLPNAIPLVAAGEEFVRDVHDAGMLVGTWVIDDHDPFVQVLSQGVDAVATNDPAVGVAARREFLAGGPAGD
ncbi:MAG TPA: glycerophosphodiester phosphodiesterase [Actinomycetota bacterium]